MSWGAAKLAVDQYGPDEVDLVFADTGIEDEDNYRFIVQGAGALGCQLHIVRMRGLVDVVSGGFPCQDISAAGKGAGIDGARSGLWREMHRIINEVRPEFAFLENSPLLVGRGLARILGDLARIGYDAAWCVLGADAVGLPHRRARLWLLAHAAGLHRHARHSLEPRGTRQSQMQPGRLPGISLCQEWREARQGDVRVGVFRRPDDGVAPEVDELKALGNGQVPAVAATAFRVLLERFTNYNPQLTLF